MYFTATRWELYQDPVVLNWFPDLEACPYGRLIDHRMGIFRTADVMKNINSSTSSLQAMDSSMMSPESAFQASQSPAIQMARNKEYGNVQISGKKAMLNDESELWSRRALSEAKKTPQSNKKAIKSKPIALMKPI